MISLQRQGDSYVRDTIVKNAATQAALDLMGTYKKSGGGQPTGNKVILIESVRGDRSRASKSKAEMLMEKKIESLNPFCFH